MSSSSCLLRHLVVGGVLAVLLLGCSKGPSKSQAFEAIQSGAKEDGSCTLPVDILSHVKMQYTTKGICVPKEGAEKARACIERARGGRRHQAACPRSTCSRGPTRCRARASRTSPRTSGARGTSSTARASSSSGDLRDGRFTCADVHAAKVLKVTAIDDTHADVSYEREITLRPMLAAIDAACGAVTRPPGESTVAFVKSDAGWVLASAAPAGDGGAN